MLNTTHIKKENKTRENEMYYTLVLADRRIIELPTTQAIKYEIKRWCKANQTIKILLDTPDGTDITVYEGIAKNYK